jgi:hypothetical protein
MAFASLFTRLSMISTVSYTIARYRKPRSTATQYSHSIMLGKDDTRMSNGNRLHEICRVSILTQSVLWLHGQWVQFHLQVNIPLLFSYAFSHQLHQIGRVRSRGLWLLSEVACLWLQLHCGRREEEAFVWLIHTYRTIFISSYSIRWILLGVLSRGARSVEADSGITFSSKILCYGVCLGFILAYPICQEVKLSARYWESENPPKAGLGFNKYVYNWRPSHVMKEVGRRSCQRYTICSWWLCFHGFY